MSTIKKDAPHHASYQHLAVAGGLLNLKAGILKNNPLAADALGVSVTQINRWLPSFKQITTADAFAGWGRKKSYFRAKALADKYQKPIITLEDGFLRSIDSGTGSRYAVSYIADDLGVYFDLTAPSRLERLIIDNIDAWDDDKQATACRLINKILEYKLSKYNTSTKAPDLSALAGNTKPHVIVIDQVQNDCSVVGAGADHTSFMAMLTHAKAAYPHHNIWIKAHPAGKGYFNAATDGVFYLSQACNPIALIAQAQAVYSVSSHMGFEALMMHKTVHCFGVAWYSGFGLTKDDHAPQALLSQVQQRRKALSPNAHRAATEQLFYSAYIDYSYYADPASCGIQKTACDIDTAINWLITNRQHAQKWQGVGLSYELSRWKSDFVHAFVGTPLNQLIIKAKSPYISALPQAVQDYFANPKKPHQNRQYDFVIAWGLHHANRLKASAAYQHSTVVCMEDGFVRSRGLGATLLPPLSVVLDTQGIYYNAKAPSDLESLLCTLTLNDEQYQTIHALLKKLADLRISKYNVGKPADLSDIYKLKQQKPHAHIRLVVGQVEDDASVQNCLSAITTNAHLLADVRRRHPEDIILYKPHPDVEAGLRQGLIDDDTQQLADVVVHDVAMPDCLDVCDVVHTISSLTGFEALIRNKAVICYGLPFYAGFGLTHDIKNTTDNAALYHSALARRYRHTPLDVATLAYAALIAYPLYRLPNGVGLAQTHQVVDYLAKPDTAPPTTAQSLKKRLIHAFMQKRQQFLTRR